MPWQQFIVFTHWNFAQLTKGESELACVDNLGRDYAWKAVSVDSGMVLTTQWHYDNQDAIDEMLKLLQGYTGVFMSDAGGTLTLFSGISAGRKRAGGGSAGGTLSLIGNMNVGKSSDAGGTLHLLAGITVQPVGGGSVGVGEPGMPIQTGLGGG